ncbi:hypothetical protein [Nitratifractor sp.]
MENVKKSAKLRKEIVQGSRKGVAAETLAKEVDVLAAVKADATKVQLRCIEQTRKVLRPEQFDYL